MEEKDFEELQSIKTEDLPKTGSCDNFQKMGDKNLDVEFVELIDHINVWKHGKSHDLKN